MKVCVYAICKNEEKFVDKWVASMNEADRIYVLDTGSTDNTVKYLEKYDKVEVKTEIIDPWRFDVARNRSLEMVPIDADICVCTDLDEILLPGWRSELENIWKSNTNRCRYIYNWSLDKNDKPIVSFYYEKIHSRKGFKWVYPVHEVLNFDGIENVIQSDNIILNHYPDTTKSRGSYLKLLEMSVKENPSNDRNMHYLGREYMYYGKWNDAIDTLIKHLKLDSATWIDERAASMRFIARCYTNLKRYDEALMWLDKSIIEAPHLRDGLIEKAILEYDLKNYDEVIHLVKKALLIPINNRTYINEVFSFDETPYDLLSLALYYTDKKEDALLYIDKALNINPNNDRVKNNKKYIEEEIKNS